MRKNRICRIFALALAAVCALPQPALALGFGSKQPALSNTEFAKKSAEIVSLYKLDSGRYQTNSAAAPLRILGRTSNLEYNFKRLGADKTALCSDGRFLLKFKDESDFEDCLLELKNDPSIVYAHRDAVLFLQADEGADEARASWGAEALEMDKYSAYIQSENPQNRATVAVVDSGISNLDFLAPRVIGGYDFAANDSDPSDDLSSNSHGTFIAGIIADATENLNVDILNVKIVEDRIAYLVNAVNGIYYAADNGADVINFSLCGPLSKRDCVALEEAVEYAISKGVTFVTCANNQNSDTSRQCPAHVENAVTVSALDEELEFAQGMSNFGEEVDVCAPGVDITGFKADGSLQTLSGTSFSAAYVAACAAMFRLMNPACNPAQVQQALKDKSRDLGDEGFDVYYGFGVPQMGGFINDSTVYVEKISFDKSEFVLEKGGQIKLTPQILPANSTDKTVFWTSENPDVAQVDELGNVTAAAPGKAKITAVTADGNRAASAEISVIYIVDINIKTKPVKTEYTYKIDGALDLEGLELEYVYSNGGTKTVEPDAQITAAGFNSAQAGKQSITVECGGFEAEFDITVKYTWWQWIIRILLLGFLWY